MNCMDERVMNRERILRSLGAAPSESEELLQYNQNCFDRSQVQQLNWPLPDEEFVQPWQRYAAAVAEAGSIEGLFPFLVQLRFPVQAGMSENPEYMTATRSGADTTGMEYATGLKLHAPERCRLVIHETAAGRIPLLIAEVREDFEALVQALTRRNEPVSIPASMGACIVAGYNNWHRVSMLRQDWASGLFPGETWQEAFAGIRTQKNLYQDRFIILSSQAYSGVPASALGLGDTEWRLASVIIRREHECAHYFTRRVFSSMRNNLLDEVIADYMGVTAVLPGFRASWLLHFLGLENFPAYREGGRLQNYRGEARLSDGAFAVLQKLVVRVAQSLESFTEANADQLAGPDGRLRALLALSCMTLEELASDESEELLAKGLELYAEPAARASAGN